MKINQSMKSITNVYNKMSNFGKILLFITLLLILIMFFKSIKVPNGVRESFQQQDTFIYKKGPEIYDDFYASIYDYLVYNNIKTDYEVGQILKSTNPSTRSVVLDIGCGTGHHVAKLNSKNLQVIGIDISPSMIKQAMEKYPTHKFMVGDALNESQFAPSTFTHILCLYFTIYYFEDKRRFFDNCMEWLMPGGYLVIHLVDRERFDPILPPGNPLYIVSPQKYAKKRITSTKVTFNDFTYHSNFNLNDNIATFDEKFKFNNGKTRKQEQVLYMDDTEVILTIAQQCGFTFHSKIDLVRCAYEYQYLYVFVKPG
jgi:SAM-dependent methyltransferase